MRGEKDEKKQMDPLFPRLHINETEKGGPTGPPRNKMALCGEINIPHLRYSSGSISTRLQESRSVPSVSKSQKSVYSSFCSWPGSSRRAERHRSYSPNMTNLATKLISSETGILKHGDYQTFTTKGPPKLIAECDLFRPLNFYNSESPSKERLGKEDNTRVPYSAGKHQTARERKEEEVRSTDLKSREHLRDRTDDNYRVSQMSGKKILPDAEANQLTRDTVSDYPVRCNEKFRLHDPCDQEKTASTDGVDENLVRFSRKRSYSTMEGPSCSSAHLGECRRIPNIIESVNECHKGNDSVVGDAERSIAISDASVVNSKSGNIYPDDVVGIIGLKLFWKLRRTIAYQQRIFAVQIFELHRLIKVQRLIAESPEVLYEETPPMRKPSIKCSPLRKLASQTIPEAKSQSFIPKVHSEKQYSSHQETEVEDAHHVKLPPLKFESEKKQVTPKSTLKPYSGSSTSTCLVSDVKLGPWFFHPGNQWLVPVRSPSEGLIYKPYTGPCPPMAGCIAPFFAGCGPTSLSRIDKDFMNTIYGVPGLGQPYALPLIEASNSSRNLAAAASRGSDLHGSTGSSPFEIVQGDALSLFPITSTVETSKEADLPPSDNTELQRIQVIKVVPRNPKLACESAARIFRSIQEERQKT